MRVLVRIREQYFRLEDTEDELPFIEAVTHQEEITVASLLVDNQCKGGWNAGIYGTVVLREADPVGYPDEQWAGDANIAECSYRRPAGRGARGFKFIQVRPRNPLPDAVSLLP